MHFETNINAKNKELQDLLLLLSKTSNDRQKRAINEKIRQVRADIAELYDRRDAMREFNMNIHLYGVNGNCGR
jgi:hypothetical protein